MVLSTFLFTDGLKVLITKQRLLNFIKLSAWSSQFKLWFNQTPKNLVLDVYVICTSFSTMSGKKYSYLTYGGSLMPIICPY
jgi:hypothetical protein